MYIIVLLCLIDGNKDHKDPKNQRCPGPLLFLEGLGKDGIAEVPAPCLRAALLVSHLDRFFISTLGEFFNFHLEELVIFNSEEFFILEDPNPSIIGGVAPLRDLARLSLLSVSFSFSSPDFNFFLFFPFSSKVFIAWLHLFRNKFT